MTLFDIGFDADHDMYLDGSDIAFTSEEDVVKQRLTMRLQFLFEEWFLDNRAGIPYTQTVLQQGTDMKDIYSIFSKEIKDTEGVDNLVSLELITSPSEKGMRVNFEVNDGLIAESVEVSI